jgi:hypothetical protein
LLSEPGSGRWFVTNRKLLFFFPLQLKFTLGFYVDVLMQTVRAAVLQAVISGAGPNLCTATFMSSRGVTV